LPHEYGVWSLLPPVLAIALAIGTRQVFVSLAAGVWVGHIIIEGAVVAGTSASLQAVVEVFADAGNTRVILFSLLVGSLIALVQRSGGVDGFIQSAQHRGLISNRRRAGLLTMAVGICIFVESNMSSLVTGTVGRPIFDRLKISREKLAYVCDSCSAPICILIPLNGWGAFILAQLAILDVEDPVSVLVASMPYNFYAIITLVMLFVLLTTDFDFGPMKKAQRRVLETGKLLRDGAQPMISDEIVAMHAEPGTPKRTVNFVLPILVMVSMLPIGLLVTGLRELPEDSPANFWNVLRACSGSTAVYWAVFSAMIFAWVLYRCQGIMKLRELVDVSLRGASGMLPLAFLMVLAFSIGQLCGEEGLSTGNYVASLVSEDVPHTWVVPLLFVIAGGIAFSTGTSWGTFAIMLAIAVPLCEQLNLPLELAVAAVLGGGVFGDHCSPISDTTVVSSMAAAADHIDHVRTQLPYALCAGAAALVCYAVVSIAN
jgi:tetracycline resistance efflux pump